ncbi:P-loop containing nucleoside triphosphate hydrolase protein, partial [Ochromonadaceae sp. CCMP2298]
VQDIQKIRNVGVVAHIDAGKTTTTEAILYISGETKTLGRVDNGDTIMDFMPQERERGITICAAAVPFHWKDHKVNLIDTPGHVDFTIEVERSARVLDGAIVVIDAVSGVQAQTKTVWRQIQKQSVPSIAFINKMDRDGASFERAVESIRSKLNANAVAIQLPLGSEETFAGVVDLISLRSFVWSGGTSKTPQPPEVQPLSSSHDLWEEAVAGRRALVEAVAELDEPFMEQYLAAEEGDAVDAINAKELLQALRRVSMQGLLMPALCGASLRGKGVEPLLDSVIAFLPSPLDKPPFKAVHRISKASKTLSATSPDLCALAFKVAHDAARGPLVFARVYSGSIQAKQMLYNSNHGTKERINQLLAVSADELETMERCGPGEVCCLVGLKGTRTGDTLVKDGGPLKTYTLDGLAIPSPVFALAVAPPRSSQQADLDEALRILCMEDPSLSVESSKESGQTLLRGLGELHLEIVVDRIRRQFNLQVTTGKAYVAYRETMDPDGRLDAGLLTASVDKMIGLKRYFAQLTFQVAVSGLNVESRVVVEPSVQSQMGADEFTALQDALQDGLQKGPRGYPVVGVDLTVSGLVRDADTNAVAVRDCTHKFLRRLLTAPDRLLLEPIMSLEVELPEQFVGSVLSDLTVQRRAQIKEISMGDHKHLIHAVVPLAGMLGYATTLRSMTQGEGSFSAEYHSHVPVDPA